MSQEHEQQNLPQVTERKLNRDVSRLVDSVMMHLHYEMDRRGRLGILYEVAQNGSQLQKRLIGKTVNHRHWLTAGTTDLCIAGMLNVEMDNPSRLKKFLLGKRDVDLSRDGKPHGRIRFR